MGSRIELQTKLETILGNRNVYFQPPMSIKLNYPCIIYSKGSSSIRYADNTRYKKDQEYQLIVIDKNPDTQIPNNIVSALEYCKIDRWYTADNLTHCSLTLYY